MHTRAYLCHSPLAVPSSAAQHAPAALDASASQLLQDPIKSDTTFHQQRVRAEPSNPSPQPTGTQSESMPAASIDARGAWLSNTFICGLFKKEDQSTRGHAAESAAAEVPFPLTAVAAGAAQRKAKHTKTAAVPVEDRPAQDRAERCWWLPSLRRTAAPATVEQADFSKKPTHTSVAPPHMHGHSTVASTAHALQRVEQQHKSSESSATAPAVQPPVVPGVPGNPTPPVVQLPLAPGVPGRPNPSGPGLPGGTASYVAATAASRNLSLGNPPKDNVMAIHDAFTTDSTVDITFPQQCDQTMAPVSTRQAATAWGTGRLLSPQATSDQPLDTLGTVAPATTLR